MAVRAEPAVDDATRRKAIVAAIIGNFVEWYDFAIYGYFATVIAQLFFPSDNQYASLLATFAVFGVAFVVRPIGALVIGSIGDRVGRRNTLAVVILLMSGSTFLIGITPTYATIGIAGPLILVLARAGQGFSAGGEFGGATSFMVEYAPEGRRALYGSFQASTQGVALMVGATLGVVLSSLPEGQLLSWGWRIPFLLALPMGLVGLYLRLRLEETPNFRAIAEVGEVESAPLRQTLRFHGGNILKVIGAIFFGTALTYLFIFLPTYLPTALGVPSTQAYAAGIVGLATLAGVVVVSALLSERLGRKPLLLAASVGTIVLTYPAFLLLQEGFGAILIAHVIFGVLVGTFGGAYPAAFSELFPTKVRYSSLSLGYSVSVSIFGGTAPLIYTYLLERTGSPLSPAFYIIVAGVVSTVAILTMAETARQPLRDS